METGIEGEPARTIRHTTLRQNLMLFMGYASFAGCVAALKFFGVEANTAIGGMLIMASQKFLGQIGTAFDYEFGSSIGSRIKDMMGGRDKPTATVVVAQKNVEQSAPP